MDCFAASGTVGRRGALQRKSNQPSRLSSLLPSIRNLSDHPPPALTKDWTSEERGARLTREEIKVGFLGEEDACARPFVVRDVGDMGEDLA